MGVGAKKSQKVKSGHNLAEQYYKLRREMAQAILPVSPLAFSMDGRTFGYEVPLNQSFRIGSYVSITTGGATYLGQIAAQDASFTAIAMPTLALALGVVRERAAQQRRSSGPLKRAF